MYLHSLISAAGFPFRTAKIIGMFQVMAIYFTANHSDFYLVLKTILIGYRMKDADVFLD